MSEIEKISTTEDTTPPKEDITPPKEDITPPKETPITAKDPKRVEQGKRLAAISKEAKEKKMRQKIKEEEFSYIPWISYGISIISTFGLFYFLFSSGNKEDADIHPMTIIREEKKEIPKNKNFESFQ